MKRYIAFLLFACSVSRVIAQDNVGIGVATPNPHALIEMFAHDKGLLIPRLTDAERLAVPAGTAETGLLVYGATDNLFYYWNSTQWVPFPTTQTAAYNFALQYDSLTGILSITDGGGTLSTVIGSTGSDDDWSRDIAAGVLFPYHTGDRVAIGGNTANASAILDVQSTTMGVLIPRMTTAQRLAISNPSTGLKVFDTTAGVELFFNGTRWLETGADPIGTINAFHKSFAGTPALAWGWEECNGQVIADAESPYNGTSLPNLNGTFTTEAGVASANGYFLRGSATSGALSADQTNNIAEIGSTGSNGCGQCSATVPQDGNWPSTQTPGYDRNNANTSMRVRHRAVETYPGNMSVVWIMRVK